ncbi:MAG TPA: MFS transporter [Anaerolineales bacterium]|nr:MFS transporter [Anaerolineales bacterium]
MQNSQQSIPKNWAARFFTIWAGQGISLFGSALVQFALVWWLTQKTGSATVLALATLVAMLPRIILGPFAGALVDRWNRRLILIISDGTIALFSLLLAWLFATGKVEIWHIYAIMAVRSLGGAFHFPAMSASTPLLVPNEQLTRVNGLNQTLQGINGLVAPPLGALLLGLFQTQAVLLIDVITAAMAILPLLFISIPQPRRLEEPTQTEEISLLEDIRIAIRYIRNWPGLVAVILMALFLNSLLTPTGALMPLLVTKYFEKGALELGFLQSAQGVGVILGGFILSVWGGFKKKITTTLMGIIGVGIGVMLLGLAPANYLFVAIIGTAVIGIMMPITNGPLGAILQSVIRPDMQGRVMSLINSAASALSPLGLLIAGPISDTLGIRVWFWAGGLIWIITGIAAFFSPAVTNIEGNQEISPILATD